MTTKSSSHIVIVFDLDDTLYKEIDFLQSGYRHILQTYGLSSQFDAMLQVYQQQQDAFQWLIDNFLPSVCKDTLLELYRNHNPSLRLPKESRYLLEHLCHIHPTPHLGIITDGRTTTQTNKIRALQLHHYMPDDAIIISERFGSCKPSTRNYEVFMHQCPHADYWYIGDNLQKDFIAPNRLGWNTVCLRDNGQNIHTQQIDVSQEARPQHYIDSLSESLRLIFT